MMSSSSMQLPPTKKSKNNTNPSHSSSILISAKTLAPKMPGTQSNKPTKPYLTPTRRRSISGSWGRPKNALSFRGTRKTKEELRTDSCLSPSRPFRNSISRPASRSLRTWRTRRTILWSSSSPPTVVRWRRCKRKRSSNSSECLLRSSGRGLGRREYQTGGSSATRSTWLVPNAVTAASVHRLLRPKTVPTTLRLMIGIKIYDLLR